MKHFILCSLLLTFALGAAAQSPRIPLLEHFTNTKCPICKSKNPKFYELFAPYTGKIHHVAIHPSVPYNTCALYVANKPDNGAREQLYGIFGTPVAFIDGQPASGGSAILTKEELDQALTVSSPIEIQVAENSGSSRTATVNIKTTGSVASGSYVLQAMVVERQLDYNAPNGETVHHDVMRKMLPDYKGTVFAAGSPGNIQSFTFNYQVDNSWQEDQIYLLVFVQNTQTLEVLNSGSKLIQLSSTKGDAWRAGKLSISPNPIGNYLNLRFEGQQPVAGSYEILDISGRSILRGSFGLSNGINRLTAMDLFPAGTYYLQLISPAGSWQDTFVKQ